MIKNGYMYCIHIRSWPGTGNGTPKDRKSFGSSYFGLTRFYGHAHVGNSAVHFYPNLSQLRRGRFCSFVFVIITNSLLLLLCRSDLIKDAVKKYDEKTKKSALFFF